MSALQEIISLNNFFSELPTDMWNEIFNFLTPLDVICVMFKVCNFWRTTIVKYYFQNYLQKEEHSIILQNIKSIKDLFNDKNLLQKFKRYLFRQYIKQKAQLFTQFTQREGAENIYNTSSVYFVDYCKEFNLEKEINEINFYCNLFTMPQNIEPVRVSNYTLNNYPTVTTTTPTTTTNNISSCFGLQSNNKHQQQTNNNNANNTTIIDEKDKIYLLKAVMLGHCGVGKTSFITASVFKQFNNPYSTITCDFLVKTHKFSKHNLHNTTKLQLWDLCGPYRFKTTITKFYYKEIDGFFICFDLNDRKTFNEISFWKKEIEKNALPKTRRSEIVLLGTKADLIDNNNNNTDLINDINNYGDNDNDYDKKIVKREEAEELEFEMELIYVETSSKEMKNVDFPTWYLVLIHYCFNKFKRE